MHNPAGAPKGDYVVIEYTTQFKNKFTLETVTPQQAADGSWQVSGYYFQ